MSLETVSLVMNLALGLLLPALLLWKSDLSTRRRWAVFVLTTAWLTAIVALGARGFFTARGGGAAMVGCAAVIPPLLFLFFQRRSAALHTIASTVPLASVVLLHVFRLIGVDFLVWHSAGRLPATFANSAGWGDVLTASLAIPVAWMISGKRPGWKTAAWLWNLLGIADFAAALAFGAGSASGSPIRFLFESPASDAVGALPLVMIPAFLVPFYLITHVIVSLRLLADARPAEDPARLGKTIHA